MTIVCAQSVLCLAQLQRCSQFIATRTISTQQILTIIRSLVKKTVKIFSFSRFVIESFLIAVWKNVSTERLMIAFSTAATIHVRLPAGDEQTFVLHLIVNRRDQLGLTQTIANMTTHVRPDFERFDQLIKNLELHFINPTSTNLNDKWLSNGHLNTIVQEITSMAQILNKNNNDNIKFAVQSKLIKRFSNIRSIFCF